MSGRSIARSAWSEKGVALVVALLGMMMLLLMIGGIVVSSTSGLRASGNHEREIRVLLVAEAGGAHVMGLIRDAALPPSAGSRFDAVLLGPDGGPNTADDGWLGGTIFPTGTPIPAPTGVIVAGAEPSCCFPNGAALSFGNGSYFARAFDDDDPLVNLAAPQLPTGENGDRFVDGNGRIIVRIWSRSGVARTFLDYTLGHRPFPAVLVNGEAELEGNAAVLGTYGSVHSNCEVPLDPTETGVELEGNSVVDQDATSSCQVEVDGSSTVRGDILEQEPVIPVPPLGFPDAAPAPCYPTGETNLVNMADIILVGDDIDSEDGNFDELANVFRCLAPPITAADVAAQGVDPSEPFVVSRVAQGPCAAAPCFYPLPENGSSSEQTFGWTIQGDDFRLDDPALTNGLTVLGLGEDFKLTGNITATVSIIAAEEVEIDGNVNLTPAQQLDGPPFNGAPLSIFANEEVEISGNGTFNPNGLIYAGEEFECEGNVTINGQVMVSGQVDEVSDGGGGGPGGVDGEVELSGNCLIQLEDPLIAAGRRAIMGWRQIKGT